MVSVRVYPTYHSFFADRIQSMESSAVYPETEIPAMFSLKNLPQRQHHFSNDLLCLAPFIYLVNRPSSLCISVPL